MGLATKVWTCETQDISAATGEATVTHKSEKNDRPINGVESSSTKNRHLAEAKHDFSAILLVKRPAIANMIMAMCNAL